MTIRTGPIALARPGWGLEEGTVTTVTGRRGADLAAQTALGAAVSGYKVLLITPSRREEDEIWLRMESLMDSTEDLESLPVRAFGGGPGWEYAARADLVVCAGVTGAEARERLKGARTPVLALTDTPGDGDTLRATDGRIDADGWHAAGSSLYI